MKLTAELVEGFTRAFLLPPSDKPIPAFHRDLWRLYCSDHTHVAIAAPRGHAKSSSGTISYGLSSVLFGESNHVLIISGTEGQSISSLSNIAQELTTNVKLIETFKINLPLIKMTATEIIGSVGDDERLFRIFVKSSGQALRGAVWNHTRPSLIICDDLESDEIVLNQERRRAFQNWFLSTVIPAISSDGKFRVAGTILSSDSLLENMMPKKSEEYPLIVEPLVEYSEDPSLLWKGYRFKAHNEDFSNILWEEQYSKKKLLGLKRMYVDLGNPDGYSQEYLSQPINGKSTFFQREYYNLCPRQ